MSTEIELNYWQQQLVNAQHAMRPSMHLKPTVVREGNHWRASFGDVSATGPSPDDAYYAFDRAWFEKLPEGSR